MNGDTQIDSDAYPVVVGIVSAKSRRAINDAAALFASYVQDVMDSGRSSEDAWRELASASVVLLTDQTVELARLRRQTAAQAVLQLAADVCDRHSGSTV